jgi:mannose-6-phosphate isomerase class I
MAVIDWTRGPVDPLVPTELGGGRECLVACDVFRLDRWTLDRAAALGRDGRCTVVLVIDGAVTLEGDPVGRPLLRGDAALLPAAAGAVGISPMGEATVLLGSPA